MKNLHLTASRAVIGFLLALLLTPCLARAGQTSVVYEGREGPGKGKHIVFLTGDEEYRSEEGLPMLAKLLSQRHGFKCTVLFALDPDGTINPNNERSLPDAEALDSADAIVMLLRFRDWPEAQMKHFVDAYERGVPIIGLRTATHGFRIPDGTYKSYTSFGKRVLGEQWVNHWGRHRQEATRGVIERGSEKDPVLNGVQDLFVTTDVYEAYPPSDATILVRGQVLKGMKPTDPPADYRRQRSTDHKEQGINDPMMAVAWKRIVKNDAGGENRVFCTTMGAATDLQNEDLRRMIVNAVYWGLKMPVPAKADVRYVDAYKPTMYGFNGFKKGVKPADLELKAGGAQGGAGASLDHGGPLQLKKGDHIAIIGNTLADRFQHDNWFETLVYAGHPTDDLVIRNLAVSGDEVVIRHRAVNFGTPDEWLGKVGADVILAFFGFNESFHGPAGLDRFKSDLDRYLKETKAKNYSGRGTPRIVLFSPIANERTQDPNLPDPAANNANIRLYTDAMAEVAKANDVQFVDLLSPSRQLYAEAAARKHSLTINGIHLSPEGDRLLAPIMYRSVFGESAPEGDFARLRGAIAEKNQQWHARYRTVDGNNVYGGRSRLSYPDGRTGKQITNYQVMQEEMSQRDVLTANRDPLVWATAQGKPYTVVDNDLPPVEKVLTNRPGSNPDGTYKFLSGEAAIAKMNVHAGCKVNLFASEEQFPELVNPVQMAWDTKGRLWVSAWLNYPERTPTSKTGDSILILEDTNGDGKADKCTHFLDNLNCPTGFQFYKDGIVVMEAPELWFVRDTNGDDKADWKQVILMGMDSADTHHTTNSMALEPGGAVYLSDGVFHRTQVETAWGPVRNEDACIYRFEPRRGYFERYAPYGFANPHGRVFDYWGNDLITDATGNNTYFGPAISGHIDYPAKHQGIRQFWDRPSRPCPGTYMMTSLQFPKEFWGNFLDCNVISFQGVYRVRVDEEGSGLHGVTLPDLISSKDPNFRPTGVSVGPDGAVYVMDWHNPLIGHMQHHLRDPSRDHLHGRIYRIVYEGRPLLKPAKIDGAPIPALLELLKDTQNQVRERVKIELGKHDSNEVIAAVDAWIKTLDPKDPAYEHHMMEALWVHQWHNIVNVDLLKRMLRSPEPHARTAATRVLCYWRDRVPGALALLKAEADDANPRVRLEVVRAASFFRGVEAVDVALETTKYPTDYYLTYVLQETMRQLDPYWRKALADGKPVSAGNPAGLKYLLGKLSTPDLLKLPRSVGVLELILARSDVMDAMRTEILNALAAETKLSRPAALLAALDALGSSDPAGSGNIARLLPMQLPPDLKPVRGRLEALTDSSKPALVRQAGWASIAVADMSFDRIWAQVAKTPEQLLDLVSGIPQVYDPDIRSLAYDRVKPLLSPALPGSQGGLRAAAIRAAASMNVHESDTYAALSALIEKGVQVPVAARGLRILPRQSWPKGKGGEISKSLVAWAKTVPSDQRTSPDYLESVQLATDLAGLLPADEAAAVRGDLKQLRVAVYVINTVREQMRFDTTRLVVEAGKPFEIIVQNRDFMPHNLAVVMPGARPKVGAMTEHMRPDQLDSKRRPYMPRTPLILDGTHLIEPGDRATLKMRAPTEEGDYEYVCTYPSHWELMWGRLVVTRDVDAYLAAHPDASLPKAVKKHHVHIVQ